MPHSEEKRTSTKFVAEECNKPRLRGNIGNVTRRGKGNSAGGDAAEFVDLLEPI